MNVSTFTCRGRAFLWFGEHIVPLDLVSEVHMPRDPETRGRIVAAGAYYHFDAKDMAQVREFFARHA